MDTGFLAAVLVAAVLVYDRLGGNHEASRRLFQVGLAVSLVFVAVSGTAAFVRTGTVQGGFEVGSGSGSTSDQANRLVTASAVQYGIGVISLIAGLVALRRLHTTPLGFILGGVFLLFAGPNLNAYTTIVTFSQLGAQSSQNVDVGAFVTAVVGTIVLLGYGMQLEREFASDADLDDEEPGAASAGDSS